MIGQLEAADHKTLGPVLIASFFPDPTNRQVLAVVYTSKGLVKSVPISELSVLWHYDSGKADWASDFPAKPEANEEEI